MSDDMGTFRVDLDIENPMRPGLRVRVAAGQDVGDVDVRGDRRDA